MAHYAKIVDGVVTNVIVAEQDFIDAQEGTWVQTSYNTRGNVHYDQNRVADGGVALRGNYASKGYIYDLANDVFYIPKPYNSWVLNTSAWKWEPPVAYPDDDKIYTWNEDTTSWVEVT